MKTYDLARSLQMKIVKDPSVRPDLSIHPSWNAVSPQSQQPVNAPSRTNRIHQSRLNQEKQTRRKTNNASSCRNNQTPLKVKLKQNRLTAGTRNRQQQKRSEKQQQQQSKLELNQDGSNNAEIPRMEKQAKPKPKKPTVVLAGDS